MHLSYAPMGADLLQQSQLQGCGSRRRLLPHGVLAPPNTQEVANKGVQIIYAHAAASHANALSGLETVIATGIVTGIFTLAAVALGFLGSSRSEARVRRREDQAQYDRLVTEAVSASEAMSAAVLEYRSKWAITL